MKIIPLQSRTLALLGVVLPLLALFVYVALRSGPLAPVAVTVSTVEARPISPSLFGVGTVEARFTYRIGPTFAGRVKKLDVHVGYRVQAGQLLGEMDPIDLDDRIYAQEAALKRAEAALREAQARQAYAQSQAKRYEQLLAARTTSEETVDTKKQDLKIANAALAAAKEELVRVRADGAAVVAQRNNMRLVSPVDGLVVARNADPGSTVVAGQSVVDVIDPQSLWIHVRFDQISATGLAAGLRARIALRSRNGQSLKGRVLRVEPLADAVTEEILAKIVFDDLPDPLPPIGELAEVTVSLPELPAMPVVSNAAIREVEDQLGMWHVQDEGLRFVAVKLGTGDLDGQVQILDGVDIGDRVVVYSEKALSKRSRLHIVEQLPRVAK
ncbi:efflux RND transporter periplasmic adaptor subunit [Haliea sp.]|uniref:efflux RND transporter periplasmic adaptor subunit n=1 Tax=Haliea sp. TaxID=1932666 RepID=UPI003529CAEE